MPPRELAFEALSAITGCNIKSLNQFKQKNPGISAPIPQTPQDIINLVLLSYMEDVLQQLLKGFSPLSIGKILNEAALIRKELFINEEDFFDPQYDWDFTHVNDGAAQFKRGNEPYKRPCGWNRIALKVLNKYKDGNGWLGTGPNAWPVSYHGTSIEGAMAVIESHYKPGPRQDLGRGIYSAPALEKAFVFSKTFTSESTNKTYNVILQNRINPRKRQCYNDYWVVPVPEGTSPADEKEMVESAIRPYGLLLKEV